MRTRVALAALSGADVMTAHGALIGAQLLGENHGATTHWSPVRPGAES